MSACHYRAPSSDAIRIMPLDRLTAVFDRRSGMTHLCASPLPEILTVMDGKTWSVSALSYALRQRFAMAADDAATEAVLRARLDELVAVGLVTACAEPDAR